MGALTKSYEQFFENSRDFLPDHFVVGETIRLPRRRQGTGSIGPKRPTVAPVEPWCQDTSDEVGKEIGDKQAGGGKHARTSRLGQEQVIRWERTAKCRSSK